VFLINEDASAWQDSSMSHASASEQAASGSFAGGVYMANGLERTSSGLMGGHGMPLQTQQQQQLQALAAGNFDLAGSFVQRTGSGTAADFSSRASDPAVLAALLAGSSNFQNDAAVNGMLAHQSMLAAGLAAASAPLAQGLMGFDSSQGLGAVAAASANNHLARMWQQQQQAGLQRGAVPTAAAPRDPRTGLMLHQMKPGLLAALAPMNLHELQLYSDLHGSPKALLQSQGMSAAAINSGSLMSGSSAASASSAMFNLQGMLPQEVGAGSGDCEVASWW
jgi:hypothetical protein